jgi:hypothetical protein
MVARAFRSVTVASTSHAHSPFPFFGMRNEQECETARVYAKTEEQRSASACAVTTPWPLTSTSPAF